MQSKPVKPLSTAEFIADALRQEIEHTILLPGEPLLQDRLASRFGVSQGSVREAFRQLEAERLVQSVKNRGVLVSSFSVEQIDEFYDLRRVLEVHALTTGFQFLTRDRIREAAEILVTTTTSDPTFLGERNRQFHKHLYAHPTRVEVFRMLEVLAGNLTRFWRLMIRIEPKRAAAYESKSNEEHRLLLDACLRSDLLEAQTRLSTHIDDAKEYLIEFVKRLDFDELRHRQRDSFDEHR